MADGTVGGVNGPTPSSPAPQEKTKEAGGMEQAFTEAIDNFAVNMLMNNLSAQRMHMKQAEENVEG